MTDFSIDFEWVSPEGARGAELRATWANLRIRVGNELVTRLEDLTTNSMRSGVYGPLYPLAEWIVLHWWSLLYEVYQPKRTTESDYNQRHNFAAAAEGFALPWLQCTPEGRQTHLQWRRRHLSLYNVHFINEGQCYVSSRQFENELRRFIEAVITRLEDEGVPDTLLAEEWNAINAADAAEQQYCAALGRLGLDPYAPESEEAGQTVIKLALFKHSQWY